MFKRKKKSPSAKDISSLSKKSDASSLSSQSYSSLPKSMYSGNEKGNAMGQGTPTRSLSGAHTLNLTSSSSNQELQGGAHSPLDLPMETLQSISVAYNLSKGYTGDVVTPANKPPNRSPFHSPVHSYGTTNGKSTRHRSLEKGEFSGFFSYDSSFDQQFERLQMMMPSEQQPEINSSSTMPVSRGERRTASMNYSRERSQEREPYPHMGARSLERDHYFHVNNNRSRSSDRQEYSSQLHQTQEQFRNLNRDSLILELQSQITDLNKDCAKLQQELDSTKDKLSSTMNSIKTFWSPELKKERSLRKEESAKYSLLNEQYKATQAELKKQLSAIRDLENKSKGYSPTAISKEEHESLKRGLHDQTKEVKILRKTVDEMELRLETQKQTLTARDESIRKLLEMLNSKGLPAEKIEESQKEVEKFRIQSAANLKKIQELEESLESKTRELNSFKDTENMLKDELDHAQVQLKQQPASTHTMQAIMEAKDSRITALERELQSLEDKLHKLGEGGVQEKDASLKKDMGPSREERSLRVEVESLKTEVSTKDNEIIGLKMKVDTLTNQQSEHQHYINVLKDQIKSKEEQSSMFQADIDDLRERLREKDSAIDKKSHQVQALTVDKRKLELETAELKDNLDIKERKINVLQRKIDNLEELLTEKEDQLLQAKTLTVTCTKSSDSAISLMEESISEKERQIERLKEERDLMELEHQQEYEHLTGSNQQLKSQLDTVQLDLTDKQTELCELREEVSELKSSRFKSDTRLRQLELSICEKDSEISKLKSEMEELRTTKSAVRTEVELSDLRSQMEQSQTEVKSAQTEVDRLLELLKDTENEKNEKDNQLKELQDIVKEYKQKFGTLKRQQQKEKTKNAHLLEEARRREEDVSADAMQLKGSVREKEGRIEELEEALRESVKITAEREMLLMEQKMQIDALQSKVEEVTSDLMKSQVATKDYTTKLSSYVKQLEEKDGKLKKLREERHKHLEEVFDMKQEALQAAICEKDANIALLEMTSTKKQRNVEEIDKLNKEKEKLNQQLKELAQNRTRYNQDRNKGTLKRSKTKPSESKRDDQRESSPKTFDLNDKSEEEKTNQSDNLEDQTRNSEDQTRNSEDLTRNGENQTRNNDNQTLISGEHVRDSKDEKESSSKTESEKTEKPTVDGKT